MQNVPVTLAQKIALALSKMPGLPPRREVSAYTEAEIALQAVREAFPDLGSTGSRSELKELGLRAVEHLKRGVRQASPITRKDMDVAIKATFAAALTV